MNNEERYATAKKRVERCNTDLATLRGQMEEKKRAREILEAELLAEGVDIQRLDEEEERLKKEMEAGLSEIETEVTRVEAEITKIKESTR